MVILVLQRQDIEKEKDMDYFIGWWFLMFKIVFIPFTILFGKNNKSKGEFNTVTASKTINKKIAICQNCGNHWNI